MAVVVVKELFTDTYDDYGAIILEFVEDTGIPVLAFDFNELEVMTRHCRSENELLSAFHQIFSCARDEGAYPRLRFPNLPPRYICANLQERDR